jgi:hypothetical protein
MKATKPLNGFDTLKIKYVTEYDVAMKNLKK